MTPASEGDPDRAELYDRLPVTADDGWWLQLGLASPDGRVLELGAGTGRLTRAWRDAGLQVTAVERDPAMLERLHRLGPEVEVVAADVTASPRLPAAGLVALPTSLLNELRGADARRRVLRSAAAACVPGGRVALQLLGPWWLVRATGEAHGRLEPADGGPAVEVGIAVDSFDELRGRRRALLSYRFADGHRASDTVDAEVVAPGELELLLADAGLVPLEWAAGTGPAGPAWRILAEPGLAGGS